MPWHDFTAHHDYHRTRYALQDIPHVGAGARKKRFAKVWFGTYLHYETLRGAVFLDSPLVQRSYDWSAGFGFAWILGKSRQSVEVPEWMPTPN